MFNLLKSLIINIEILTLNYIIWYFKISIDSIKVCFYVVYLISIFIRKIIVLIWILLRLIDFNYKLINIIILHFQSQKIFLLYY